MSWTSSPLRSRPRLRGCLPAIGAHAEGLRFAGVVDVPGAAGCVAPAAWLANAGDIEAARRLHSRKGAGAIGERERAPRIVPRELHDGALAALISQPVARVVVKSELTVRASIDAQF